MNHFIYITSLHSTHGKMKNSQLTSLPMCGFIAQLVEHRTGIAEVTGSNPVEALIFFRLLHSNCLNWKFTAIIIYHLHIHHSIYITSLYWLHKKTCITLHQRALTGDKIGRGLHHTIKRNFCRCKARRWKRGNVEFTFRGK